MEILRMVCYGYADEDEYSCECKYDKMHGEGTYKWASGSEDDGEWKIGDYICQGTRKHADRHYYIGGSKDNQNYGQGAYKDAHQGRLRMYLY